MMPIHSTRLDEHHLKMLNLASVVETERDGGSPARGSLAFRYLQQALYCAVLRCAALRVRARTSLLSSACTEQHQPWTRFLLTHGAVDHIEFRVECETRIALQESME